MRRIAIFLFLMFSHIRNVVAADCYGEWGPWGSCEPKCGNGAKKRQYKVLHPRVGHGKDCDHYHGYEETKPCQNYYPCFMDKKCLIKHWDADLHEYHCATVDSHSSDVALKPCSGLAGQLWTIKEFDNPHKVLHQPFVRYSASWM